MADNQPSKKNDDSSGDEHFSDASEGGRSPIPITRVERVDDVPAHGEVPGTPAYSLRTQDAVPDEVEIVPDGMRSRSSSRLRPEDRPLTPGGTPVPILQVEKIDPETPAHGEVPGTAAHELRKMDASPDVILKAPEPPKTSEEESKLNLLEQPRNDLTEDATPSESHESTEGNEIDDDDEVEDNDNENNMGFGDDFDDFEEGEEGDDDFGDFDDGFQQEGGFHTAIQTPRTPVPPVQSVPLSVPPILDFNDYTTLDEVISATQPYISNLFPSLADLDAYPPPDSKDTPNHSIFLSERSLSLWSQLVAPPPLQPPNWVRSRIRRLFLVSLGVPVDLDEILPASKQKKLVLPSINLPSDRSPRLSSSSPDRGANGAIQRLKQSGANASTTSVDSSSSKPGGAVGRTGSKRRGPPPAPELDLSATTILCSTTEAALNGFTDEELRAHVARLKELLVRAGEVLEYWGKRRESAMGDKEAFEGVIENLVKHAKKVRK